MSDDSHYGLNAIIDEINRARLDQLKELPLNEVTPDEDEPPYVFAGTAKEFKIALLEKIAEQKDTIQKAIDCREL
jgi:hypothetical protein